MKIARESTRDASAEHDSRDEYRAHTKYTHPFASSFSSSPIAKDALSDGFHHSHECIIHARIFPRARIRSRRSNGFGTDERTRARRGGVRDARDVPGDGGGRELRGRGHGWRESSTSADDDDDEDDDDDRPLDRRARPSRPRDRAGMSVSGSLVGVRLCRVRVREVCAVETIHVHPSLLGHTIRTLTLCHIY